MKNEVEIQKLKNVINNSANDSIFLHDIDGNFMCFNETAYETLGYTKKDIMKMNINDLDLSVEEGIKFYLNELVQSGSIFYKSSQDCKNGNKLEVEIDSCIMESKTNKVVLSITKDIKKVETRKQNNDSKYHDMVHKSDPGILIENMGLITHVNNNICNLLGYTKEELLGYELINLLTGIQEFSILDELIKVKKGGKSTVTSRIQRKDGSILWALTKISPIYNKEGDYQGNVSIYSDITELRRDIE
jgi:PAS domain S-box-containing protein